MSNNYTTVYLSGRTKDIDPQLSMKWRKDIQFRLEATHFRCFIPDEHYTYQNQTPTGKECMQLFLHQVELCDIFIVNLNDTDISVGTGMEISLAYYLHKPIIGFADNNSYLWIKNMCDVIVKNKEEAIEYILQHYSFI